MAYRARASASKVTKRNYEEHGKDGIEDHVRHVATSHLGHLFRVTGDRDCL